ncbi:hypothetical protein [Actinomyces qiguomingii]|uniref:hypothetical protein n=1 Tax=Actinomyces qiguomingii TaxID=2057800 RepID=UPI0011AF63A4|nr:hypothetical protein [Actinomyces qiguomingii]
MGAHEITGAGVKTDAELEARAGRPGPGGAVLRVVIAIAVMLLSATVPVLVMAIPGVQALLDGKVFGRGTAGLLALCLAVLAIMSTATLVAFVCTRLLINRLDHASPTAPGAATEPAGADLVRRHDRPRLRGHAGGRSRRRSARHRPGGVRHAG